MLSCDDKLNGGGFRKKVKWIFFFSDKNHVTDAQHSVMNFGESRDKRVEFHVKINGWIYLESA